MPDSGLAETAAMATVPGRSRRVREAYTAWSATYDLDRNLTRDLDGEVTREILGARHARCALEIGCGTGKNTVWLAERSAYLLALDLSPGMVQRARQKVTAPHVDFALADLTQGLPCSAQRFDLITCNLVLEHIDRLDPVFAQAARCLTADGLLLVSELHPFRQYQGAQARFTDASACTVGVPAFAHHVSDFLAAATQAGLRLLRFREWWHRDDTARPPRLATFEFQR